MIELVLARDHVADYILEARPFLSVADISVILRKRRFFMEAQAAAVAGKGGRSVVHYVVLVPDVGVHPLAAMVARQQRIQLRRPATVASLEGLA